MIILFILLIALLLREHALKKKKFSVEPILDLAGNRIGERVRFPVMNPLRLLAIDTIETPLDGRVAKSRTLVDQTLFLRDTSELTRVSDPDIRNWLTQILGIAKIRMYIREGDSPTEKVVWVTKKQSAEIIGKISAYISADCKEKEVKRWTPN